MDKNTILQRDTNGSKNIYICHEYYTPSHFLALYNCAAEYGYTIKDYLILSPFSGIRKLVKPRFKVKNVRECISAYAAYIKGIIKLCRIKNDILIVGVAPYNYILNMLVFALKRNKAIYFTSHQYWDGSRFVHGKIQNKARYEKIMSKYMAGVACVSKTTENGVKKINKNTQVVYHSIDWENYKKKNAEQVKRNFHYLFLGQLIERKNISLILNWLKDHNEAKLNFCFAGGRFKR